MRLSSKEGDTVNAENNANKAQLRENAGKTDSKAEAQMDKGEKEKPDKN